MQMNDLYAEIILDHSRAPHHAGLREPFDAQTHQVNPTCGDEVTLRLAVQRGDSGGLTVQDVSYDALGCSISQASVSVMTDLVIGESLTRAQQKLAAFEAMITSKGADPGDEDLLGDAVAFAGVAQYPNRVKCALLGWKAFKLAAAQAEVSAA
ncbi:MAG: SUF system NifU family Fe-S cluster assembly protein [Actinobacteria bacterium 69-20]|nr:SUF system NifU family Fe-S cluster assembly protein [Actinomycetota bacterium]OJV30319.1 MAG: SUF system NifU family Fe-S cluster assembly protein [Actinobacteria bacterium 69-20]